MAKRRAKRKNPSKKRRNPRRKRRNGPPSWLKNFAPKKRHKRRNAGGHHRVKHRRNGRRRSRRNPSWASILPIFKAAGAGMVVGFVGTNIINSVLASQSGNVKSLALIAAAAGAAVLLPGSPVLAAGIATGLLLVPGQQVLAGLLPSSFLNLGSGASAAPAPVLTAGGQPAAGPPAVGWLNPRGMGYLNPRGMAGLSGGSDALATMGIGKRLG